MITRWRKTAMAGGALLVAATLAGCLRVDVEIELDGQTASGEAVFAVSQEVLDGTGASSSDVLNSIDLPEGTTVEPYDEDGYVGQRATFEDTDLSEFDDPESVTITHDEEAGRYEVGGRMDFSSIDANSLPADLAESFEASVSVTFPGDVIEHNGELDGNTVTWQPEFGEANDLHAVADDDSGGLAWLWVTLVVLAALLVIGSAVVLARRRGGQSEHEGLSESP